MVNLWLMMRKPGVGWFAIPYAPITCWLLNGWLLYCMNWPTRNGHLWCGILEMEFSKSPYPEIVWKCTYMNKSHLGPRCGNLKVSEPPTCSRCCWSRYMHIYYVRVWYFIYIYIYMCLDAPIKRVSVHLFYTSDTARVYNSTESKCKQTSKAVASCITTCVRC